MSSPQSLEFLCSSPLESDCESWPGWVWPDPPGADGVPVVIKVKPIFFRKPFSTKVEDADNSYQTQLDPFALLPVMCTLNIIIKIFN